MIHLSSLDRDMPENILNRLSGSSMVDMGILSNIMESLSPKCYKTFWDMTIYSDTSIDKLLHQFVTLLPNRTLLPTLTLLPIF